MSKTTNHFGRAIMIDICKDGTISFRNRGSRAFNGKALPVFSVDTEQEANSIQVAFGKARERPNKMTTNFSPSVGMSASMHRATHSLVTVGAGGFFKNL